MGVKRYHSTKHLMQPRIPIRNGRSYLFPEEEQGGAVAIQCLNSYPHPLFVQHAPTMNRNSLQGVHMECPRCDGQGTIDTVRIRSTSRTVFVCDECNALWENLRDINRVPWVQAQAYFEKRGMKYDSEFVVIEGPLSE